VTENVPTYPDLQGKVALVTGGSGGIGAATCRLLAAPFLASESSSWITGVTLDVAGGRIMHRTKPAGGARVGARRGGDGKDHRRAGQVRFAFSPLLVPAGNHVLPGVGLTGVRSSA
jgi:hypothetical protein